MEAADQVRVAVVGLRPESGAKNVLPNEVEAALVRQPAAEDATVARIRAIGPFLRTAAGKLQRARMASLFAEQRLR